MTIDDRVGIPTAGWLVTMALNAFMRAFECFRSTHEPFWFPTRPSSIINQAPWYIKQRVKTVTEQALSSIAVQGHPK